MLFDKQIATELGIVTFNLGPQVKTAIRALYVQHRGQYLQHRIELLAIQVTVGAYMGFVVPGRNAGQLGLHRHGAAVVGAVQQERLENVGISRHKTRTQTRQVRALGQAVEHHATLEVLAAQGHAGAEQANRRGLLVEVQLAVALVRSDHEVVFVGQGDEFFQGVERDQRAGRVAWRAQEQDLAALPGVDGHRVEIRVETMLGQARQVVWLGACQEGCPFVDLVERVRADDQGVVATVDHGLGESKQGFTGAIDRQDVARRVEPALGYIETSLGPAGDGFAQRRDAQGGGVDRHLVEVVSQRLGHEVRGAVFRFANRQGNRTLVGVGLHAAKQGAQFFERVRLQLVQSVVHGVRVSLGGG